MKTNDEIRRENLELAIKRVKTAARLAELSGTAPAYLSQIKTAAPDSKSGTPKTMGDDVARRIEAAIGEGQGWMDMDHSEPNAKDAQAAGNAPSARPAQYAWINDWEAELLTLCRTTDDRSREEIMRDARLSPRVILPGIARNQS